MNSLAKLTDNQVMNALFRATEIKLDKEFIQLLRLELLKRGIEVKQIS